MKIGNFFYALWSAGIVGLFLYAAIIGYSPFASANGRPTGGSGFYGPRHK